MPAIQREQRLVESVVTRVCVLEEENVKLAEYSRVVKRNYRGELYFGSLLLALYRALVITSITFP